MSTYITAYTDFFAPLLILKIDKRLSTGNISSTKTINWHKYCSVIHYSDKAKPIERWGRKTTGLGSEERITHRLIFTFQPL
jgi:hypothetical protein